MKFLSGFTFVAAVGLGLSGIFIAPIAMAQTSPKPWDVTCDAATSRCTSQAAVVTDKGERVAVLGIQINKDGTGAVLYVATQFGVALRPGVRVLGEKFETTLQFDVCLKDGCRASIELDAAGLQRVLSVPTLDLQMFPFGADAALSIPLPMDGLATSLAAQVTLPKP